MMMQRVAEALQIGVSETAFVVVFNANTKKRKIQGDDSSQCVMTAV
jgi:hypothetical protein